MKKIMFLYHVKERELEIINLIEKQIREYNSNVEIRKGEAGASIFETIQFMPDIIVTAPPRDCYSANYFTMLKIVTGAVMISMVTEGYVKNTPEKVRAMIGYHTYARELVDYYIMWGPKTRNVQGKALLNDNKLTSIKRVKTTGYAFYELDKVNELYKKNAMYKFIQSFMEKYEKNILVVTGFMLADSSINDFQIMGYFGNDTPLSERSDYEIDRAKQTIKADEEFRKKYIDAIITIAQENPNTGIIVKLHPIEINDKKKCYDSLRKYHNILLIKEAVPIGVMLKSVDCIIHYNSTCNLEAYIYKVPSIQLYGDIKETYLEFTWQQKSASTYLVHIDDTQTLLDIINKRIEYRKIESVEKILYNNFNWKRDKEYRPIEKIAYYISNAKRPQRLRYGDKEIIKAIESSEGRFIINKLLYDLIENIDNFHKTYLNVRSLIKVYKFVLFSKLLRM